MHSAIYFINNILLCLALDAYCLLEAYDFLIAAVMERGLKINLEPEMKVRCGEHKKSRMQKMQDKVKQRDRDEINKVLEVCCLFLTDH